MSPVTDLVAELVTELDVLLAPTDVALARSYPGPSPLRQPIHTVYVPADRAGPDTPAEWGAGAVDLLSRYGDAATMAAATGLAPSVVEECLPRVRAALLMSPVDDLRIDFEDGYGPRDEATEDADADRAGATLAAWRTQQPGTPFVAGIRCRSLDAATRARAVRTIDAVVRGAVTAGGLPPRFVITLPKLRAVRQVEAMVTLCDRLEQRHDLAPGSVRIELQIEATQAVVGADGIVTMAPALHAAAGRCTGLHYGTYDYSAACGITAAHQSLAHPAADHAKAVMQAVAAETGAVVSDGSTQVLPVGDAATVRAAWALHAALVTRSLERGFYQGWDLHPGQLVSRRLATTAFFRTALPAAGRRLSAYLGGVAGDVLDEPATARALATVVTRGLDCGAIDPAEATAATGLGDGDLRCLARTGRRSTP